MTEQEVLRQFVTVCDKVIRDGRALADVHAELPIAYVNACDMLGLVPIPHSAFGGAYADTVR